MWYDLDPNTGKITKVDVPVMGSAKYHETTKIDDVDISTVFLALDHRFGGSGPPVLFETMIFGGRFDEFQERYCTLEEAKEGHRAAIFKVKGLKYILGKL